MFSLSLSHSIFGLNGTEARGEEAESFIFSPNI